MESILLDLNTDAEDFFSELSIACMLLQDRSLIECNDLAQKFFHLGEKQSWDGVAIEHVLREHPMEKSILSVIEEAATRNKIAKTLWDEDYTYYIQAKTMKNERMIIIIQDRTYEKKYDQLLLQKMQLESVSHLAAGVAHELRNPLSVIQGFIQLSNMTGSFSRYYKTISSEITRMNQIIEDFLSISRKKVEKKYLKPAALLNSIKALIQSECLLHGVTFDYKLHNNEGYLFVNESMIKQVMLNLLRNTIEAYDIGTKNRLFRLHAGKDNDKFVMMVEDNGPGMSDLVRESLGTPFYTTKDSGTGIGIPMCKKIIKEHDGEFLIDSIENKGTKITIQLPVSKLPKSDINSLNLK